jgi:hypothetical protein
MVMAKARDLAELFTRELKWFVMATESTTKRAEKTFRQMLSEGYSPEEIQSAIHTYKKAHPNKEDLEHLITVEQIFDGIPKKSVPKGLMRDGVFYFHPRLQVAPGAPVMTINEDGEFVSLDNDEFFLEIRPSFTMAELVDYFYKRTGTRNQNYKRDSRAFEYVLDQIIIDEPLNALDLILFTIDAAVALAFDLDRPMPNALEIEDYLNDGLALYTEKYNYCKLEGLDHVTPRG